MSSEKVLEVEVSPATLELFQRWCGSDVGPQEIKERVLQAHAVAAKVHSYRCINDFKFMTARVKSHPLYETLCHNSSSSTPSSSRPARRLLDLGCCMGTDVRQMILDGVVGSPQDVVGVDLHSHFFEVGFELFRDKDRLQRNFVCADVLALPEKDEELHPLLQDPFEVVYCGSVFHLLSLPQTVQLAKVVHDRLLAPGGLFFGRSVCSKGPEPLQGTNELRYLHSLESFRGVLQQAGFVEVSVQLIPHDMVTFQSPSERGMLAFSARKSH